MVPHVTVHHESGKHLILGHVTGHGGGRGEEGEGRGEGGGGRREGGGKGEGEESLASDGHSQLYSKAPTAQEKVVHI